MNICKTVTLRTRKIKEGRQLSFYLDYYPGYRDEATMKVIRHESLGIYIYAKPKNQRERDYNERMTERAEALRCRRYEAVVNERYDFFDKEKTKGTSSPTLRQRPKRRTPNGNTFISISTALRAGNALSARLTSNCATVSRNTCLPPRSSSTRNGSCTSIP